MSERSHRHNPAAHSRSRPTRAKRGGPGHIQLRTPAISIASVPRQRWVPNRGKQTAAPLSLKRGTRRECTVHANSPLKEHRVRAPCPNKRRKDSVCVIGCQIQGHGSTHNLKRLASARHDREKLYSYQNARFKQNSQ